MSNFTTMDISVSADLGRGCPILATATNSFASFTLKKFDKKQIFNVKRI